MNMQEINEVHKGEDLLSHTGKIPVTTEIISRLQLTLETLSSDPENEEKIFSDFFEMIEIIGDFPVTPFFRKLVEAQSEFEKTKVVFGLLDHLSYKREFYFFGRILSQFRIENSELKIQKFVLQQLSELEGEDGFAYCSYIKKILVEETVFIRIKNLINFYYLLYPDDKFFMLKKGYEHFFSFNSANGFFEFIGSV